MAIVAINLYVPKYAENEVVGNVNDTYSPISQTTIPQDIVNESEFPDHNLQTGNNIYKNIQYGFTFEYPTTLSIEEWSEKDTGILHLYIYDSKNAYGFEGGTIEPISISIEPDKYRGQIFEYLKLNLYGESNDDHIKFIKGTTTIAQTVAYILSNEHRIATGDAIFPWEEKVFFANGNAFILDNKAILVGGYNRLDETDAATITTSINKSFETITKTFSFI